MPPARNGKPKNRRSPTTKRVPPSLSLSRFLIVNLPLGPSQCHHCWSVLIGSQRGDVELKWVDTKEGDAYIRGARHVNRPSCLGFVLWEVTHGTANCPPHAALYLSLLSRSSAKVLAPPPLYPLRPGGGWPG